MLLFYLLVVVVVLYVVFCLFEGFFILRGGGVGWFGFWVFGVGFCYTSMYIYIKK